MVFVRYELLNFDGGKQTDVMCNIIDTDFEEVVSCTLSAGLDIVNPFIDVYERRGLNVGYNLVMLCKHISTRFKLEIATFIKNSMRLSSKFAKYRDDVEKYLVLV